MLKRLPQQVREKNKLYQRKHKSSALNCIMHDLLLSFYCIQLNYLPPTGAKGDNTAFLIGVPETSWIFFSLLINVCVTRKCLQCVRLRINVGCVASSLSGHIFYKDDFLHSECHVVQKVAANLQQVYSCMHKGMITVYTS